MEHFLEFPQLDGGQRIEVEEQVDWVQAARTSFYQGHYFYRPGFELRQRRQVFQHPAQAEANLLEQVQLRLVERLLVFVFGLFLLLLQLVGGGIDGRDSEFKQMLQIAEVNGQQLVLAIEVRQKEFHQAVVDVRVLVVQGCNSHRVVANAAANYLLLEKQSGQVHGAEIWILDVVHFEVKEIDVIEQAEVGKGVEDIVEVEVHD